MESKPLGSSHLIEVDFDPFAGGELTVTVPSTEPQREIWTAVQMGEDASCAFNESVSVHLQGELHEAPLIQALRDLLARHESLRATFSADGLSMCVAASPHFELGRVDLSAGSAQERDAGLRAVQREEVTTPFGLERGPLFRARLIQLTPQDHVLTLSAHHIVFDGWSMAVVVRELGELYTARKAGREPTLSPAPLFSDYARAERAHAATAAHAADERFWRSSFEGSVPVLELPADRSRPPMRTFSSAREDHRLEPALVERLKKAGARAGASFFTTLLAGFGALLHRLTGQDDLVMGIPAAGQSVTGQDGLVGHCVNTLPLRTHPDGDRPFTEYLKMVRGVMLDGYEHQRYTLGELLKQLPLPRDASRLPVVSVLFNVDQAVAGSSLRFEGLTGRVSTNARAFESFEIFINAAESRGQVVLETQYNADIFEGDTIRRWLSAFEQLLEGVAADPSTALSRLPLLNAEERARVLGWNDTAMPFDRAASVHELFERQVARAPDAIAVTHVTAAGKGVELTYAELNRRANQVARRLRGMGVAPAALVGLCVERSPDLLVGMLAILKTGAAYIPLDPGFPRDRLTFMVADSKLEVVVSTSNLVGLVAERLGGPAVLALDTDAEAIAGEDVANLEPLGAPETSAYVIYTSGSTGKPKGVMVPHRAVVNFLETMRRTPGMTGADTVLAVTTLSFDIAVLELHLPFSVGARVVLASREVAQDGGLLLAALEREGATVMQATPSTWRLLIAAGWEGKRPLKVLCGGEALPKDLAGELARRAPDCWNMYGPTETTVWSTCWRIQRPIHRISIGRPIGNTQVYLLDAHLQPVPVGVPGELHIGGDGVTLGYLNRPELTAERFVPDPFSPVSGARLYKTGDLARYLPDGNIEYLRRNDTQVKVRGYRIELGEIESALSTHPGVKQASVIVREDRPGDARLVGYLVPHGRLAAAPDEASLRSHLKVTLPDYMVPQHFVAIEALPLTPNGKIDRKALPAPAMQDSAAGEHVEARTDTERALATIWQEVLGLDRVGVTANFFSLGGHSLLAAQVVSRVSRDLGVVVPLRKLFEGPTIEQLARASSPDGAGTSAVDDMSAPPKKAVRIPRRSDPSKPAPASPMQQRMWLFDVMDPGNPVYNLPAAFRMKGPLDIPALRRALNEIFRRHEATRTTLQWQDDEPVQVIAPSLTLPLEPIDMRAMPAPQREAELLRQMRAAANASFDISTGPLVRAELYLLDENENALFFMPHHAVWDGWSFDIFLSELATLYDAFHRGLPSPLAELPVSYADFSTWHREWLQGEELERQSAYWRNQLAGELGVLELPTDHPRPPQFNYRGATEPFVLTKAEIDAITALGRSQGATLYMVLLSAFKTLLFRYTGQQDILVGTPVRGRMMPEVEDVIGFFVNALVLRTEVKPELTFRELLGRVRGVVLDAFSHQDMPFERILQDLNVQRDPSRTPIYQAFFTFQDVSNRGNTLGDEISYGQIHVHAAATQTDILFWVKETGGGLVGGIDYSTDLFEQATIVRMLKQLRTLLRAVTQDADVELGEVQILPEAERQQLQAWNETALEYPRSLCAHELIEAQVRRTPDAPALVYGRQTLSYRELNRRANQVARRLRAMGVAKDSLVGLFVERSPELVIGMLGILKAGAAYIPLDPAFPRERLAFMAQDSKLPVLVSHRGLRDELFEHQAEVLWIDDRAALDSEPGEDLALAPDERPSPESLCYVIYTSGSTGKPKGVMIPHRAVVNFLTTMRDQPGLTAADVLLAVTTLSFDIAVLDLHLTLSVGAKIILAGSEAVADGEALRGLIERERVTVMQATPSTWRLLIAAGWKGSPTFRVFCGGEPLPPDLAAQMVERSGVVWNMYGPTETTIYSTRFALQKAPDGKIDILIGKPVGNTQLYVLDPRMQQVPIGAVGELHIGGDGVTRGYLFREELTQQRFIDNPLGAAPGPEPRLYKTGDLVRFRADGNVEYLRRNDNQVKVRGYRIELGEIESAIAAHPAVAQAVVLVREDHAGDRRIVGYMVKRGDTEPSDQDLRRHLRKTLPEYMVPQHFVVLDKLPLTPNGKIDRKALPAPLAENAVSAPRAEARNDAERLVAEIWQHALQVKQVGVHDNFFDLGGHSLLSLQVTAEIERRTGVRLSPRVLLLNSLEQVAALLPAATAPAAATQVAAAPEPVGSAGSPTSALAASSWIPPVARPLVDRVLRAEPSWLPPAARPLLQQMRTWLGVPEASPVEPEHRAEFEPRTVTADTGAPLEPMASDRIPLFFGRPDRQIFAVHHLPAVAIERTTAILLCAPAPQEYMQTHWALRRLAGLLAKDGFHVLRFDYSCTGDSAGAIEEGDLAQWRQDIRDAAGVLKERSGLRKVSVVGMRLGAALAVQAVSEGLPVQTLVLWEPVVDGRAYLKELTEYDEVRRTWFLHPPKRSREELMGYRFPDSMRRSLEQVQLLEAPLAPPDRTALVIAEETQSYRAFSARLAREAQSYEYRFVPEKARGATREGALLSNAVLHDIVSVLTSERRTS